MIVPGQRFLPVLTVLVSSVQYAANAAPNRIRHGLAATTSLEQELTTYIISFADEGVAPAKRCAALAKSTGGTVQHVYDFVLNGCSLTLPLTQAQAAFTALSSSPVVRYVEDDQKISINNETEDGEVEEELTSNYNLQVGVAAAAPSWGLDRINQCSLPLDSVVSKQDATGVKVFIIDTGIFAEHEEFANTIGTDDCHFSAFSNEIALSDGAGHGYVIAAQHRKILSFFPSFRQPDQISVASKKIPPYSVYAVPMSQARLAGLNMACRATADCAQ